ncbi:MAG TPA: thiamine diphosphokinase [Balneolales bacterium]|nr:thiamine diphosphokinase [Balneolales bacterium]
MSLKHALVLCNGEAPPPEFIKNLKSQATLFIATDGAGNTALEYGIRPDIVIGDLDSFNNPNDPELILIKDEDQETNDLEKALTYTLATDVEQVTVIGASGKRIDHTLKNLSVLKQFSDKFMSLGFRDIYGVTYLMPHEHTIDLPVGTPVSLFPLSGRVEGITTKGLKYSLHDEPLENGIRDGSSNEICEQPAHISYKSGDLLIFVGDSM